MPDILGGSYYGTETEVQSSPGSGYDNYIGYESYAPDDGYIESGADLFDAFGETLQWGGGSDPYQSPMLSTSDIIRSRDAGIPYPASPINKIPEPVGSSTERSGLESLFKGVVDVFGKSAVVLAGTLASRAIEREVPGRSSSGSTKAGSATGLPTRPFVLPSILGGGTFAPTGQNMLFVFLAIGAAVLLFAMFSRR